MVAVSQCCSVVGIWEWGKYTLDSKVSYLEKDNVDVSDDGRITVPRRLLA